MTTASPPAAPGMPGEEELRQIVEAAQNALLAEGDAVSAILSLIRTAFEAKDAEIERWRGFRYECERQYQEAVKSHGQVIERALSAEAKLALAEGEEG